MKTSMEQQYEKRILYHICSLDMPIGERVSLLQDFHNNSADYYDRLCDILYAIANDSLHLPVWMTASGRFYAASAPQRQTDLHITDAQSVPDYNGDLLEQLEHIFLCMYKKMSCFRSYQRTVPTL